MCCDNELANNTPEYKMAIRGRKNGNQVWKEEETKEKWMVKITDHLRCCHSNAYTLTHCSATTRANIAKTVRSRAVQYWGKCDKLWQWGRWGWCMTKTEGRGYERPEYVIKFLSKSKIQEQTLVPKCPKCLGR